MSKEDFIHLSNSYAQLCVHVGKIAKVIDQKEAEIQRMRDLHIRHGFLRELELPVKGRLLERVKPFEKGFPKGCSSLTFVGEVFSPLYLGDLAHYTEESALSRAGVGKKSLEMLKEFLQYRALELGMDIDGWPEWRKAQVRKVLP